MLSGRSFMRNSTLRRPICQPCVSGSTRRASLRVVVWQVEPCSCPYPCPKPCGAARRGQRCQCSPPAKPVLTLHTETFPWENPDLVEPCLWESPGRRLMRRMLSRLRFRSSAQPVLPWRLCRSLWSLLIPLSSAWTAVGVGMALCDADCFLHAANSC